MKKLISLVLTGMFVAVSFMAQAQTQTPASVVVLPQVTVQAQPAAPDASPYGDPDAPYKADRLSSDKFTEPLVNTPRSVMSPVTSRAGVTSNAGLAAFPPSGAILTRMIDPSSLRP